jgi:hypothetical protein
MLSPHQKVSLQEVECTKFSQSSFTHVGDPGNDSSQVQLKTIFNIGGDHLTLNMAIVLFVHALHF